MKSNLCIGIITKSLYLYTFLGCKIQTLNPYDEDSKIVMTYHFYISNDKIHDSYFVQHYLRLHWEDLVKA
jgi:hypothetical protein